MRIRTCLQIACFLTASVHRLVHHPTTPVRPVASKVRPKYRTRWDCFGERQAPQSRTRHGAGRHREPVYARGLPRARAGCPRVGDQRVSVDTRPEGRLRPEPLTSRATEVRPRHRIRLSSRARRSRARRIAISRRSAAQLRALSYFAVAAIDRVATQFPETRFAIIDFAHDDLAHRPKNVLGIVFREEQAGYLAGHLAALVLTLSPGEEVISSVGGQRVPAVERFIAGYQAGARGANPRVTNSYTDSFLDPVKGRSVALSQIAKGSRVVFQVASACGLGALEAAKERGIWGIGVDVDQSHLGRHILTSAVKRLDVAVFDTIEELVRGTLETGRTSRFSLRNGGVGLGTISAGVPRSLKAEIEDVRAEIVAGKIPIASSVT